MSDSKSSSTTGKSSGNTVRGSKKNATLSHPPASSKTDSPLRKVKKEESSSESSGSDSEDEFSVHVTRDSKNAAILKTAAEIEQSTYELVALCSLVVPGTGFEKLGSKQLP